jgi:hypothetical protein
LNKTQNIELKISEFQMAMERYHNHFIYHKLGVIISTIIVILQAITFIHILRLWSEMHIVIMSIAFLCAYGCADFINGLAHLYMDNNTNYNSVFGPFIAAFHLHHVKPRYAEKKTLKVYFYESGTKFWLVIYLICLVTVEFCFELPVALQFFLVCVGILSSFAEVSHYWCHNSDRNVVIHFLQKKGVLLSKHHHLVHHIDDNKNYAFLNGMTNFLLNLIAQHLYEGYKSHADQHAKAYSGKQTTNR